MFPSRYFPDRYFAPRYWPKLGFDSEDTEEILPTPTPLPKRKHTFIVESKDGTFRYATEDWEFTEITREINGSMMVKIRTDQLTTEIAQAITDLANRVTIRISTDDSGPQGIDYFSGYIPNRQLNLKPEDQSVEITAFGFASRLFDIPYRDGATILMDYTTATGTPAKASEIAQDVIDKAQALDSDLPIDYTASSIEDSTDDVEDKFIMARSGDVLNRAVFLAFDINRIWHWVVTGDNVFRFKKNSTTADHSFVYDKHVLGLPRFSEDLQQAVNEVLVVYNGGANIKRVVDQDSIDTYGLMSLTVHETNIPDADTATELGNAVLASRIAPIRSITITVGSSYPIELVKPGDTCRIDGIAADIQNLLTRNMFITRNIYRRDTVDLELSLTTPYIQSQVENIRRRFEKESVENIGATAYA